MPRATIADRLKLVNHIHQCKSVERGAINGNNRRLFIDQEYSLLWKSTVVHNCCQQRDEKGKIIGTK
jgi:hypothetical protein